MSSAPLTSARGAGSPLRSMQAMDNLNELCASFTVPDLICHPGRLREALEGRGAQPALSPIALSWIISSCVRCAVNCLTWRPRPSDGSPAYAPRRRYRAGTAELMRSQKITFGEMHEEGSSGIIVDCQDYKCSHNVRMSAAAGPIMFAYPTLYLCSHAPLAARSIRSNPSTYLKP